MSSVTNPQSEPPNQDELVAYLDGELPPEECRVVEERLANDAGYRQQLRGLDQAWEALSALPPTAVDDGFARTTIELACVVAEEDLSKRKAASALENRSRTRWWIAGGVAAAVVGFLIVRALAVQRDNALLADLPVIEQFSALMHVSGIGFLQSLSAAGMEKELVKDDGAFDRAVADFTKANSETLAERREWVNSLTPQQKADLAEQARAFEELRRNPEEKERLRKLTNDISHTANAPALQRTLVAYGRWLSRKSPGEKNQLREDFNRLSTDEQVDTIRRRIQRDTEQAARHLSPEEIEALRREIIELAKKRKAELMGNFPQGQAPKRITSMDAANEKTARLFLLRELFQDEENRRATISQLLSRLGPKANEHWHKLPPWQQWGQLLAWIQEALPTRSGPEDLERFFMSDELTDDDRQALLNKSRSEMEADLERRYLRSELGFKDLSQLRELGEPGRGTRRGPRGAGPDGRPGDGPGGYPDRPPFAPDGRPRNASERERRPPPGRPPELGPAERNGRPLRRPEGGPPRQQQPENREPI